MGENEKHWFVIHTSSGHEERVKKNLEQRIKLMDSGDEISQGGRGWKWLGSMGGLVAWVVSW